MEKENFIKCPKCGADVSVPPPKDRPIDENSQPGKEINVENYSGFCEGDIEPSLRKKIRELSTSEDNFIVFLDENLTIQYSVNDAYGDINKEFGEDFGSIMNQVVHLEALSQGHLEEKELLTFKRILIESVSRLLEERSAKNAASNLKKAEEYLIKRTREKARLWFLSSSIITTSFIIFVFSILWTFRDVLLSYIGSIGFQTIIASLVGSIGALISVLNRSDTITTDFFAGRPIHFFEGAVRIIFGIMGAFIVALGIESNFVLGIANRTDYSLVFLLFICAAAGASERIVPNLIKQVEDSFFKATNKDN